MRITIFDRIRALFAKDEYDYWFKHVTDEEKALRSMDSWELANVIHEETVANRNPQKRIVAEHMLQVRLVKLQNQAVYTRPLKNQPIERLNHLLMAKTVN